jgi:antitoxin component of MazEF toxin-antitoxin module
MKKTAKNKIKRTQGSKTEPVRKITKTGNYTYYVTIPKSLIAELGWQERQKVVVERKGASLVVRDWKK